jgi:hypothetical protein
MGRKVVGKTRRLLAAFPLGEAPFAGEPRRGVFPFKNMLFR